MKRSPDIKIILKNTFWTSESKTTIHFNLSLAVKLFIIPGGMTISRASKRHIDTYTYYNHEFRW